MWKQEMAAELGEAVSRERRQVVEKYRQLTGKSVQSLYRIARQNGFDSGRKQRCDTGRCVLNDDQIAFVAGLIHTSSREKKGSIMDTDTALEIAFDNGIIERGTVSVSRMQAILAERGISRTDLDAPEPSIKMRSLHPNHVHVFDASVCIQYYLKGNKGLQVMREDEFYKNKPHNVVKAKDRLIRYVLADHFSHCIYVKYYLAAGERMKDAHDFLITAWKKGKHEKFPFHGVPFYLLMDAGAANVSRSMTTFLKRLDIETPKSLPPNPKRQGSAEVTQHLVESKFESRLRFHPVETVEDLNRWAVDWCAWFNGARRHSRHSMTRTACWLTIRPGQIRELPERDMLEYLFAQGGGSRLVDNHYCITYSWRKNGVREYRLKHIPDLIPNRTRVEVTLRPYDWPAIGVTHNDTEYVVEPVRTGAGGFAENAAIIGGEFKAVPDSITQRKKKEIEQAAYGDGQMRGEGRQRRVKPGAVAYPGISVFGGQADKITHGYMPRAGNVLEVKAGGGYLDREIPITDLIKKLAGLGKMTPELNSLSRETYGATVSVAEARRVTEIAKERELTAADLRPEPNAERKVG